MDNFGAESVDEEEQEKVDPRSLKPDLYAAAQQNDTTKVLELLAAEVPATYVDDSNGWTPLHWAAKNGNVTMLNKMIECGASAPYHRMVLKAKQEAAEAKKKSSGPSIAAFAGVVDNVDGLGGMNENDPPGQGNLGLANVGEDAAANPNSPGAFSSTVGADGEGAAIASASGALGATSATSGVPATATTAAIVEEQYEDEEDEDDEYGMEKRLETSVDLTKNTPLLWACIKGHLNCVWALLVDGYSPNDLDDMGNNALHLAAAAGNRKVVKILIDDGARPTIVNTYKNLPIDMATDKEVREMISDAMLKGASMTSAEIELKHDSNLRAHAKIVNSLNAAVNHAKEVLDGLDAGPKSPRSGGGGGGGGGTLGSSSSVGDTIRMLGDALRIGKEWSMDQGVLSVGAGYLALLETSQELVNDMAAAEREFPFRSQAQYIQHFRRVEAAVEKAEQQHGVAARLISQAKELLQRAQIECWISTMMSRVSQVECAMEHHEHDMNMLKASIVKGQVLHASSDIIGEAVKLHRRLECELGMSRALSSFPTYKLPWTKDSEPPPEGYYTEADFGHVKETEEYPNPPAETGEYIWEPSVTYSSLKACIAKLKESFTGADEVGADPKTMADAKAKLLKAEKDFKLLHVKEENDKLAGIEETKKKIKKKPAAAKKK